MLFAISCKGFVHFEFLILINQVLYTFWLLIGFERWRRPAISYWRGFAVL
jgi:hypothetical protein